LVKKGATLGANCTIVCGHTIGAYAFIAAGAVITGSVPDYALMAGNPARRKGWMCACGPRIKFNGPETACCECGNRYRMLDENSIRIIREKSRHESSAAGYKNPLPIN
jgi:UDP-2-acetamido-3-amino-2,3-dideoxy-glucuronate N-acetyltransferase